MNDVFFLKMALVVSQASNDPSTKVGAVIANPYQGVQAVGFNSFPQGIAETYERLADRSVKLELMVHAEMNAVLAAARAGISVAGCTLYIVAMNNSGDVWGGPPCTRCTVEIIQAGITRVVTHPFKSSPSKWADDIQKARLLLEEAGVALDFYTVAGDVEVARNFLTQHKVRGSE